MRIDLNCDLGEGEPLARTRALMRWITSANIACGGHAGDITSMEACVRLAREFGVRIGAHPGLWSREDFGRSKADVSPDSLELLLLHQVTALQRLCESYGVALNHIKLHGALYHAAENNKALAQRYVAAVGRWWPGMRLYVLAGGKVAQAARKARVVVSEEVFADRNYRDDGSLVPRTEPGALFKSPQEVIRRVRQLQEEDIVTTISGQTLMVMPQTICIHSDTPNAPTLARLVRLQLQER